MNPATEEQLELAGATIASIVGENRAAADLRSTEATLAIVLTLLIGADRIRASIDDRNPTLFAELMPDAVDIMNLANGAALGILSTRDSYRQAIGSGSDRRLSELEAANMRGDNRLRVVARVLDAQLESIRTVKDIDKFLSSSDRDLFRRIVQEPDSIDD